jgi:hypothetical protein
VSDSLLTLGLGGSELMSRESGGGWGARGQGVWAAAMCLVSGDCWLDKWLGFALAFDDWIAVGPIELLQIVVVNYWSRLAYLISARVPRVLGLGSTKPDPDPQTIGYQICPTNRPMDVKSDPDLPPNRRKTH